MSQMPGQTPPSSPPPPPPQMPYASTPLRATDPSERMFGMLCHITALVGFIGPLVVWLIKKEQYPFVDDQGKESLNFQISLMIYAMICVPLVFAVIGIFLLLALPVYNIVLIIIASMKANEGERYRYPLTIRLIK